MTPPSIRSSRNGVMTILLSNIEVSQRVSSQRVLAELKQYTNLILHDEIN